MDFVCLTPDALDAVAHPERPVIEERLRRAPPGLGVPALHPGPPAEREIYGTPYARHLETEHFTINWEEGQNFSDAAARAAEALEAAWTYFVDEKGWTPPVSSDRYYLWVLLVDDLGGTGLTTEYFTDEYADGYPVIYLNASWAPDAPFWESLAIHEFHHTLQYALRAYDGSGPVETWYWEASATWASSLVVPDTAALDYIVPWYGDQTSLVYSSDVGSHQYGMYVFNAWLDTEGVGPESMKATWDLSPGREADTWRTLLEEGTGQEAGALWAGFAGAFGNDTYGRGATWQDPVVVSIAPGDEEVGSAAELGTVYYRAGEPVVVAVEVTGTDCDVTLSTGSGVGQPQALAAGATLAVTVTTGTTCTWTLTAAEVPEDTGGSDTAQDSGGLDREPDGDGGQDTGVDLDGVACGCASAGGPGVAWAVLVAGLGAQARRRRAGAAPHAR